MKTKFLALVSLFVFITSCSSDDTPVADADDSSSSVVDPNNSIPATALPLTSGSYWAYKVHANATTTTPETWTRDSLYVANDTVINTVLHKKMKTKNLPNGFYSGTLNNNGLRIDGSSVKITGAIDFSTGLPTALSFAVADFIILKENATAGSALSATEGAFVQDVSGFPLTFTYTLKSFSDGNLSSYTSNGTTYSNIIKTKIILNLKITTTFSGVVIPVMAAQDVLVSNQYYSKNIGMVYNLTNINYSLNSNPLFTLPIPQSGSQTQEEFLDVYHVN